MINHMYVKYYDAKTLEPEPTEQTWSSLRWLLGTLKENKTALTIQRVTDDSVILGSEIYEKDTARPSKYIRITLYPNKQTT